MSSANKDIIPFQSVCRHEWIVNCETHRDKNVFNPKYFVFPLTSRLFSHILCELREHRFILTLDQANIIRKTSGNNKITHCKDKEGRFGDFLCYGSSKGH